MHPIRPPAVSGTWYPGSAAALAAAVDEHLVAAAAVPRLEALVALVAPHAGLVYSGRVAARAYRQVEGRDIDVVVMVGPSHRVGFDGVAIYRRGGFDTPLGVAPIDEGLADRLLAASPVIHERPAAHEREHSLEMQLPFVRRLLPRAGIVPLVVGWQTPDVARELGRALAAVVAGASALIVASSDLSHFEHADRAHAMDRQVIERVEQFDADALQALLDGNERHACGGGPMVAVMRAARLLGARDGVILGYGDSSDVSGDRSSVVGYLAAAFGTHR
ncbi:MAG TPA: AmmeMemoRadiSam system protein B [Vicinamibacterales bacterium]|nr:AmmeMemoRadiSam system protein B [Vicinamibacterales bacterium]